jgi:DNA repair exonuclease SbcCD ATPase subunit
MEREEAEKAGEDVGRIMEIRERLEKMKKDELIEKILALQTLEGELREQIKEVTANADRLTSDNMAMHDGYQRQMKSVIESERPDRAELIELEKERNELRWWKSDIEWLLNEMTRDFESVKYGHSHTCDSAAFRKELKDLIQKARLVDAAKDIAAGDTNLALKTMFGGK